MELMNNQFRIGSVYCATPALVGARQRLVIPVGRHGRKMQVATVDDFCLVDVAIGRFGDREFARGDLSDGHYTFSAACEVSAADYAVVRDILGVRS